MEDFKCFRCGSCCKGFFAFVPKTEDADLSPEFLEAYYEREGFVATKAYIDANSQPMGEVCPWLLENEDGTCSCKVYEHRSSNCRNYPGTAYCNLGEYILNKKRQEGKA